MTERSTRTAPSLDIDAVRRDFPILSERVHDRPLVYLDNAATTQKPQQVVEAVSAYYRASNANVHRGVHGLSQRATEAFEGARLAVQRFINAGEDKEIIWTRGATEAVNLVANTWGRDNIGEGDEILLTQLEHHSNIVPWQMLAERVGAHIKVLPIDDRGQLELDKLDELITDRTRLIGAAHVSNSLGTVNPVKEITQRAHARGVTVMIDGAQAVPHVTVDVQDIGCDFYAFSGHKVYGPTGIGALYGRRDLLESMSPWMGGGDMILSVTFEKTTYNRVPFKFEAGTPNIAGAVGLAAALAYVDELGLDAIAAHEDDVLNYGTERLQALEGVRMIGTAECKAGVLSFVLEGIHPHDAGTILDQFGVAVRAGHHCSQPVMQRFGIPATLRASLGLYNTREEIDVLIEAIEKAQSFFA